MVDFCHPAHCDSVPLHSTTGPLAHGKSSAATERHCCHLHIAQHSIKATKARGPPHSSWHSYAIACNCQFKTALRGASAAPAAASEQHQCRSRCRPRPAPVPSACSYYESPTCCARQSPRVHSFAQRSTAALPLCSVGGEKPSHSLRFRSVKEARALGTHVEQH